MAVFDANFLVYLLDPGANPPHDPETSKPVTHFKQRIEHLIAGLEQSNDQIIIPTPALSEYLVRAGEAGVERLQIMQRSKRFRFSDFGTRAAIELAALTQEAIDSSHKKSGVDEP